jgi:hypothetical protein
MDISRVDDMTGISFLGLLVPSFDHPSMWSTASITFSGAAKILARNTGEGPELRFPFASLVKSPIQ